MLTEWSWGCERDGADAGSQLRRGIFVPETRGVFKADSTSSLTKSLRY